MLIRYFYIRSSKRSESNTEIQSSNIFKSDIRPSLEEHGFFKYFLGIFEIFEKQISMFNAYFQKKKTTFFMMMIIFLPRLLSSHAAWYKKNSDNQYFLIISLQQNFYAPSIKMHKFTLRCKSRKPIGKLFAGTIFD